MDSLRAPVSFPGWRQALQVSTLAVAEQEAFFRQIVAFLSHCKAAHAPASIELAKQYLAALPPQRADDAAVALRWFFRAAKRQAGAAADAVLATEVTLGRRLPVPPPAATDTGASLWENALIEAMRRRNFLWRTEETYRRWAGRFAQFIAPRSPYAAGTPEVSAFLSAIAVEQRASASTQKQALNALVFLMQEALHRELGELQFHRARKPVRLPAVLSREECRRLLEQLQGTHLLMGELMYGSGLRLMELLRLRIQHVDFERGQLRVAGGKGDKDRATVLPQVLVPRLRSHVERLRGLFEQDRAAQLPGVWLPDSRTGRLHSFGTGSMGSRPSNRMATKRHEIQGRRCRRACGYSRATDLRRSPRFFVTFRGDQRRSRPWLQREVDVVVDRVVDHDLDCTIGLGFGGGSRLEFGDPFGAGSRGNRPSNRMATKRHEIQGRRCEPACGYSRATDRGRSPRILVTFCGRRFRVLRWVPVTLRGHAGGRGNAGF